MSMEDIHVKSLVLRLDPANWTNNGVNETITFGDYHNVYLGNLTLKSYSVYTSTANTQHSVYVDIKGFNQDTNEGNHSSYLTLPLNVDGTSKSTMNYLNTVVNVSGSKINRSVKYTVLKSDFTTYAGAGAGELPLIYLIFQYGQKYNF